MGDAARKAAKAGSDASRALGVIAGTAALAGAGGAAAQFTGGASRTAGDSPEPSPTRGTDLKELHTSARGDAGTAKAAPGLHDASNITGTESSPQNVASTASPDASTPVGSNARKAFVRDADVDAESEADLGDGEDLGDEESASDESYEAELADDDASDEESASEEESYETAGDEELVDEAGDESGFADEDAVGTEIEPELGSEVASETELPIDADVVPSVVAQTDVSTEAPVATIEGSSLPSNDELFDAPKDVYGSLQLDAQIDGIGSVAVSTTSEGTSVVDAYAATAGGAQAEIVTSTLGDGSTQSTIEMNSESVFVQGSADGELSRTSAAATDGLDDFVSADAQGASTSVAVGAADGDVGASSDAAGPVATTEVQLRDADGDRVFAQAGALDGAVSADATGTLDGADGSVDAEGVNTSGTLTVETATAAVALEGGANELSADAIPVAPTSESVGEGVDSSVVPTPTVGEVAVEQAPVAEPAMLADEVVAPEPLEAAVESQVPAEVEPDAQIAAEVLEPIPQDEPTSFASPEPDLQLTSTTSTPEETVVAPEPSAPLDAVASESVEPSSTVIDTPEGRIEVDVRVDAQGHVFVETHATGDTAPIIVNVQNDDGTQASMMLDSDSASGDATGTIELAGDTANVSGIVTGGEATIDAQLASASGDYAQVAATGDAADLAITADGGGIAADGYAEGANAEVAIEANSQEGNEFAADVGATEGSATANAVLGVEGVDSHLEAEGFGTFGTAEVIGASIDDAPIGPLEDEPIQPEDTDSPIESAPIQAEAALLDTADDSSFAAAPVEAALDVLESTFGDPLDGVAGEMLEPDDHMKELQTGVGERDFSGYGDVNPDEIDP